MEGGGGIFSCFVSNAEIEEVVKINGEWKIECMSLEKMVTEPEPRDMTAGTQAHSVHIEFCVS